MFISFPLHPSNSKLFLPAPGSSVQKDIITKHSFSSFLFKYESIWRITNDSIYWMLSMLGIVVITLYLSSTRLAKKFIQVFP